MNTLSIKESIDKLGADFPDLHWDFKEHKIGGKKELVSQWLGEPDEDIMVCVFKGKEIHEKYHRQDFSFSTMHITEIMERRAIDLIIILLFTRMNAT